MSERENFLARWSRRKLEIEEQQRTAEPPPPKPEVTGEAEVKASEDAAPTQTADDNSSAEATDGVAAEKPEFDFLSHLPPIESIGATTDIRPFLSPGVPQDLTRAALRRAWSVDPSIRDYIGPAENQWDFASGDLPGFGPLELTEDLRKIVAEIVGGVREEASAAVPATPAEQTPDETQPELPVTESSSTPGPSARPTVTSANEQKPDTEAAADKADEKMVQDKKDYAALQQEKPAADDAKLSQRGHGSALPR